MSAAELKQLALALPPEERADLAEALWESFIGEVHPSASDSDFIAELHRRDEEMESGKAIGHTHEEVMAQARARLSA